MKLSIGIYTELNSVPLDYDICLISIRLYPLEELSQEVSSWWLKNPTTLNHSQHIQLKMPMNN